MKIKILAVIGVAALLATFTTKANTITLVNGYSATNYNVIVGASGTNTSGVVTNNAQVGVILAATTNYFNLSATIGGQAITNKWPAQVFSPQGGYPGSMTGPFRTFQDNLAASTTVTNASAMTLVRKYAGYDGIIWYSNIFSVTVTIPVNTTFGLATSNFQSSFSTIAVQQDEWSTAAVAVTNMVNTIQAVPGI